MIFPQCMLNCVFNVSGLLVSKKFPFTYFYKNNMFHEHSFVLQKPSSTVIPLINSKEPFCLGGKKMKHSRHSFNTNCSLLCW